MESVGLLPIGEYIRRQQATISEKVDRCPIYELCDKAELIPGTRRLVRWWGQDVINEPEK